MKEEKQIDFEFICLDMPGRELGDRQNVRLGIQKGKAVVDDLPADAAPARFRFSMRVKEHAKSGRPNFLGPYAQGKPDERFIYLCWGERQGEGWQGFGRVKVQLNPVSWEQIEAAVREEKPITARITMTDEQGKPMTASVKSDKIVWE